MVWQADIQQLIEKAWAACDEAFIYYAQGNSSDSAVFSHPGWDFVYPKEFADIKQRKNTGTEWHKKSHEAQEHVIAIFGKLGISPYTEHTDGGVVIKFKPKDAAILFSHRLSLPLQLTTLAQEWVQQTLQQQAISEYRHR
jgi:hypothetical protein